MNPIDPWTLDAVLASAHHLLVFSLVAVLVSELVLMTGPLDGPRLRQVGLLDGAYGALAGLVLLVGGLRVVYGIKGWAFYSLQPMFWAKIGVFALIGLLSIVPTLRLLRWRRQGHRPDEHERAALRRWIWAEVLLLPLLPVFAVLMARGIGR